MPTSLSPTTKLLPRDEATAAYIPALGDFVLAREGTDDNANDAATDRLALVYASLGGKDMDTLKRDIEQAQSLVAKIRAEKAAAQPADDAK